MWVPGIQTQAFTVTQQTHYQLSPLLSSADFRVTDLISVFVIVIPIVGSVFGLTVWLPSRVTHAQELLLWLVSEGSLTLG